MDKKKCPGCLMNELYSVQAQFIKDNAFEETLDSISFLQGVFFAYVPMKHFCDSCRTELLRSLLEQARKQPETQNQVQS